MNELSVYYWEIFGGYTYHFVRDEVVNASGYEVMQLRRIALESEDKTFYRMFHALRELV
jgi:hypothetical protein